MAELTNLVTIEVKKVPERVAARKTLYLFCRRDKGHRRMLDYNQADWRNRYAEGLLPPRRKNPRPQKGKFFQPTQKEHWCPKAGVKATFPAKLADLDMLHSVRDYVEVSFPPGTWAKLWDEKQQQAQAAAAEQAGSLGESHHSQPE